MYSSFFLDPQNPYGPYPKAVALYARAMADAVLEGKANATTEVVQAASGDEFVEVSEDA